MRKQLLELHYIGVYPMDIHLRNYKGGQLVGFGTAWTKPYFLIDILPQWQAKRKLTRDLRSFDELVKASGSRLLFMRHHIIDINDHTRIGRLLIDSFS